MLRRSIGLPLLVLYGLGTTIGAGIYVLIGEIAGVALAYTPIAFLAAGILAAFSAGSFAELSRRFPHSAGEALYVQEGLGIAWLGVVVGLLVVAAGTVSAAAIANGFANHAAELWGLPHAPALLGLVLVLTGVAIWGVGESLGLAGVITLVELFGLGFVLWVTRGSWSEFSGRLPEFVPPLDLGAWKGIGLASILAFYAFLGFEDMVNVAEEVVDVRRNLPRAIGITLVATISIYALVATAAVLTVPPLELAASDAPLVYLHEQTGAGGSELLGIIAVLAVVNGALVQIIMASRVLYGLGSRGALPGWFARVHPRTQTPIRATALVGAAVALLATSFPLIRLAESTSLITLSIFAVVNLSLVFLHQRSPLPPDERFIPRWIPVAGTIVSLGTLTLRVVDLIS